LARKGFLLLPKIRGGMGKAGKSKKSAKVIEKLFYDVAIKQDSKTIYGV